MSPRLDLELEQDTFAPGDVVRGTVRVVEGGGSRDLDVLVLFHEDSDDYERVAWQAGTGPLHTGDLTQGAAYSFTLPIPETAVPSYRSSHGELWWEVDARSDELGRDTHARKRIEVVAGRNVRARP